MTTSTFGVSARLGRFALTSVATLAVFSLVFISLPNAANAEDVAPTAPVSATAFTEGRVSLTFDDGWESQYINALPLLTERELKATFYIYTNAILDSFDDYMTSLQIGEIASLGHELGAHTRSHSDLMVGSTTASYTDFLNYEIQGSVDDLVAMGASSVTTFAYPYGSYGANGDVNLQIYEALQSAGLVGGARSADTGPTEDDAAFNSASSNKWALGIGHVTDQTSLATIQGWVDEAKATNVWLVLMFHEIADPFPGSCVGEGDTTECTSTQMLTDVLDYIVNQNVCVQTVAQVLEGAPCSVVPVVTYDVTASVVGGNGTIDPTAANDVAVGSDVVFTITPASGYHLNTLTVNSTPVATTTITTTYTLENVQANTTVEVTFAADDVPAGVDTTALQAKITEAQTTHDGATEGTDPGQYPAGSKATLQAAITTASDALDAETQQEVNDALSALQAALDAFLASVVPDNSQIPAVCPDGYTQDGETCVSDTPTPACDAGYTFNGTECVPESQTATCATGTLNETTGMCEYPATEAGDPTCNPGEGTYDAGSNICMLITPESIPPVQLFAPVCTEGELNPDTDKCEIPTPPTSACPANFTYSEGNCVPTGGNVAPACSAETVVEGNCPPATTSLICPTEGYPRLEGTFCLADEPVVEPPPSGGSSSGGGGGGSSSSYRVRINNNANETNTVNVTLTLTRGSSNATQVWISNDSDFASGAWAPWSSSKSWTLAPGAGEKTVYVRFGRSSGSILKTADDEITLTTGEVLGETTGGGMTAEEIQALTTLLRSLGMSDAVINEVIKALGGGEVLGATTDSGFVFTQTLQLGSTGNEVTELQKVLIAGGYLTLAAPTGYFGPLTEAAVKAYQTAHGLPAVGIVGPLTRAALNAGN